MWDDIATTTFSEVTTGSNARRRAPRTSGRGTQEWDTCLACRTTGVAGNQISGTTLHSLLHLPINKDFKPLSAIDRPQLQKKLKDIQYLIIDEESMLGLRQLYS